MYYYIEGKQQEQNMDLLCTEEVKLNDTDAMKNRSFDPLTAATTATTATTTTTSSSSSSSSSSCNKQHLLNNNNNNNNNNHRSNNSSAHVNTAINDPTFLGDRCLENLLKTEEKFTSMCLYFKTIQKDITPPMRKIVAEWMMEVCEEEKCQEEVVLLALNYMDRFLTSTAIRKNYLQILAAACLLLASKLREPSCRSLTAELLVFYTDNSVQKQDLIHWELFVLSRLKWDLSSVTPLDFLELLLFRLPIRNKKCLDISVEKVRIHAQAFISLSAKEHYFSVYTASTIASSSIAAALRGLNWHLRTGIKLICLLNRLTDLTGVGQDCLQDCMTKMENIFEEHSQNLQPFLVSIDTNKINPNDLYNKSNINTSMTIMSSKTTPPNLTQTCKMQANTQHDIQDIKF